MVFFWGVHLGVDNRRLVSSLNPTPPKKTPQKTPQRHGENDAGPGWIGCIFLAHFFFQHLQTPKILQRLDLNLIALLSQFFWLSVESKFFLVSLPKPQCFSHHHNILPFVDADMRPLRMPWSFPIA